jgi:hypothetical protein
MGGREILGISSYRELRVWQVGMDVAEKVYCLTQELPKQEVYETLRSSQKALKFKLSQPASTP